MAQLMHRSAQLDDDDKGPDDALVRRPLVTKTSALGILVASVLTVGAVSGVWLSSGANDPSPPANSGTPSSVNPTPTSKPASTPAAASQAPTPFAMDDRGFIKSDTRCEGAQSAVAIGRTDKSLVLICKAQDGRYEYRGVRLSLGTGVSIGDVTANADKFIARNGPVTYVVSAKELDVLSGDVVVSREPMVEYRTPQSVPAPAAAPSPPPPVVPAQPVPPAPQPPRPPETPSANYPHLPFTAEGTGDGVVRFAATAPWQFRYVVQCPADTAVMGFIDTGGGYRRYYVELRGDTSSRREGASPRRDQMGPIVVTVKVSDQRCEWALSIGT